MYSTSGQSVGVELREEEVFLESKRVGSFSQANTSTPVVVRGPVALVEKDSVAAATLAGESRTVELSTRTLVVKPTAGWS